VLVSTFRRLGNLLMLDRADAILSGCRVLSAAVVTVYRAVESNGGTAQDLRDSAETSEDGASTRAGWKLRAREKGMELGYFLFSRPCRASRLLRV
jgi:hypothetical protein